nr:MAG TPA: hypothetical protein [Bacteriophage sp.]
MIIMNSIPSMMRKCSKRIMMIGLVMLRQTMMLQ